MEINIKLLPRLIPLLTIIFVIAKIMGKFDYSWWIVFAPIWVSAIVCIIIFIIILLITAIVSWID